VTVKIILAADVGMSEYEAAAKNVFYMADAGTTMQRMAGEIYVLLGPASSSRVITNDGLIDEALSGSGYDYSLVLHSGDLVYAMGYLLKWELLLSKIASTGLGERSAHSSSTTV